MVMLAVVPGEELLAEGARIFERSEAVRELRPVLDYPADKDLSAGTPVLERLELAVGVGIVVGDMRTAVGLGHAQIGHQ